MPHPEINAQVDTLVEQLARLQALATGSGPGSPHEIVQGSLAAAGTLFGGVAGNSLSTQSLNRSSSGLDFSCRICCTCSSRGAPPCCARSFSISSSTLKSGRI